MSEWVAHLRTMRGGTGETDVSITAGPVQTAYEELVRDMTERCGHVVRRKSKAYTLDGDWVRVAFEVDVTLAPDKYHAEPRTYTWVESVQRLAEPYRRMAASEETR